LRESRSDDISALLQQIYGDDAAGPVWLQLQELIDQARREGLNRTAHGGGLTERDVFLITYADMVRTEDEPPLLTLHELLQRHLKGRVSGVHLLPFFPYSSDDGFSVIDYQAVDPRFGSWSEVEAIGAEFRLMVDAVINHVSAHSEWFQGFLRGETPYRDFFFVTTPDMDLPRVVRPRDLPLETAFDTVDGIRTVWTTFSEDQIDLDYGNPSVLLEVLSVILNYVRHGAQVLRLDAVAFLWKEPGTASIHLRQTHLIIRLIRAVLETVAPWVILITETNVPHEENISYFGDGTNEAHLVYQFPLPPLVLYTLKTGDTQPMVEWIRGLTPPSSQVSFFNFLASHDGIGLRPAQDLLPAAAVRQMVRDAEACGGGITYRQIDAGRMPYELNITYFDALADPAELEQPSRATLQRFLCAHSLLFGLQGVPAIYFHSLFASRNDVRGVANSGRLRSINREKLNLDELEAALASPHSIRHRAFYGLIRMLEIRQRQVAFHPQSEQEVLDLPPGIIGIRRHPIDGTIPVTLLHNAGREPTEVQLPSPAGVCWLDLLEREPLASDRIHLESWAYRWLIEISP
jgi:sucrose phosphorylase